MNFLLIARTVQVRVCASDTSLTCKLFLNRTAMYGRRSKDGPARSHTESDIVSNDETHSTCCYNKRTITQFDHKLQSKLHLMLFFSVSFSVSASNARSFEQCIHMFLMSIFFLLFLTDLLSTEAKQEPNVQIKCMSGSMLITIKNAPRSPDDGLFSGMIYPKGLSKNSSCLTEYR